MKKTIILAAAVALLTTVLPAQEPTWAENLFRIKTGRVHPEYEKRVKAKKAAQEQAEKERLAGLFTTLDTNRNGVIDQHEWPDAKQPAAGDKK